MMTITVLSNRFPQVSEKLSRGAAAVVARTALQVEADWKDNIRAAGLIETGTYLNSVQAQQESEHEWVVGTGLVDPPYPWFLEGGTSRGIPAHGVATAAGEANADEFVAAMTQLLEI